MDLLSPIILSLHDQCLSRASPFEYHELQKAFLCGHSLSSTSLRTLFQQTGLIHIIVVSGSHLIFIQSSLGRLLPNSRVAKIILGLVLVSYSLTCYLDPPIFRALIHFSLHLISHHWKLHWPGEKKVMISGLLCLLCFPEWIGSYSLILSWLASLAVGLHHRLLPQSLFCYFILCPVIYHFSAIHPLTILMNWLVAPIFAVVLFPVSILSLAFHPLQPIIDFLWGTLISLLEILANYLPQITKKSGGFRSAFSLWYYLWLIQLGLLIRPQLRILLYSKVGSRNLDIPN